eukprot:13301285-Alexandrium_andersonii.AAC.1
MGLSEQPRSMPRGEQEPLERGGLPGPPRVTGEVIHVGRDPDRKGAANSMEDGVVGQRPKEGAW